MQIWNMLGGMLVMIGVAAAARAETSPDARDQVSKFEKSLFADRGPTGNFKQRPEAEQRPIVEAYFATLKTPEEKLAFLGVGDYRYVYAINRALYCEFAAKLLGDSDAKVRKAAIQGLVYNSQRKYSPEVAHLLDDAESEVRISAAVALGWFGRHDLAPRLAETARTAKQPPERAAALLAIGLLLRDKAATARQRADELSMLSVYLDAHAAAEMQQTALAFAYLPEAGNYLGAILNLIASTDAKTRGQCVKALAVIEGDAATAALRHALQDPSNDVRRAAVDALGALRSPCGNPDKLRPAAKEAAGDVAKLLEDPDVAVRGAAVETLAAMVAVEYADAIAKRLGDENSYVQERALPALAVLKSRKHAPNVAAMLHDKNDSIRLEAVRTLMVIGTKEQAQAVAGCAEDTYWPVRIWALRALDGFDARGQRAVVEKMTRDPESDVAYTAKELLAKWK